MNLAQPTNQPAIVGKQSVAAAATYFFTLERFSYFSQQAISESTLLKVSFEERKKKNHRILGMRPIVHLIT
jgi:hypothetical protein